MPRPNNLGGLPAALARPSTGLSQSQWRSIERQWQRHLHQPSRRPIRPSIPKKPLQQQQQPPRRHASSDAAVPSNRIRNGIYGTGLVLALAFGYYYITDTRASIHHWLAIPALRILHTDPEEAHHAGIRYIKGLYDFNLHARERGRTDEELGDLKVEVFGHILSNPVGTSAGIDKDGLIPSALLALGPAVVEVGGTTPHPQKGNPKPRVFRIPSQNALINRYGLNSEGAEYVAMQLRERVRQYAYDHGLGLEPESERQVLDGEADVPPGSLMPGRLLAVQVAKNKTTPDHDIRAVANDYVTCVDHLAKYADILVVNVSSPNTPGLRDLQAAAPLTAILIAVVDAARACNRKTKPAVMVKVSPDEDSDAQIDGICSAVWASGVDGVIVGNTTNKRPDPFPKGYIMPVSEEKLLTEIGGYSGPQMFERTLDLVKRYRARLDQGPQDDPPPAPPAAQPSSPAGQTQSTKPPPTVASDLSHDPADASVQQDIQRTTPSPSAAQNESKQQPKQDDQDSQSSKSDSAPSSSSSVDAPKVIFATGGITDGEQCLQILNAGASVCQIYTAMMYGGVGTVTRMKREMRQAIRKESAKDAASNA